MASNTFTQNVKSENFLRAEAELVLDKARKEKAEKNKTLGDPITLTGVPIDIKVRGKYAWIAENAHQARKLDLETGRTLQIYRGHFGPVTSLAFHDKVAGSGDGKILITGSWDKTIKVWDTDTKALISSTPAHSDFVKTLLVLPALQVLVSASSDKSIRFWDLTTITLPSPLQSLGSISGHTRPVESLDAYLQKLPGPSADPTYLLFTADTMGVIKVWNVTKEQSEGRTFVRAEHLDELLYHRTRVNEVVYGDGNLWTASADDTIQVHPYPAPSTKQKPYPPITHKAGFKAVLPLYLQLDSDSFPYVLAGTGDVFRLYDVSSLDEPEFIREVEGHWHDVTHLRLWLRESKDGRGKEVWIVSSGLDWTIRKWKLSDLLATPKPGVEPQAEPSASPVTKGDGGLTEDEERELAELMGDDES